MIEASSEEALEQSVTHFTIYVRTKLAEVTDCSSEVREVCSVPEAVV